MRAGFIVATLFAAYPATIAGPALAQASLCTSDAVILGDDQATVRAKCGEPIAKRTDCAAQPETDRPGPSTQPSGEVRCTKIEQWTYRSASQQPTTVLKFEAGRLRSIDDDRSATSPSDR